MKRRHFLTAAATATVAGCTGRDGGGGAADVRLESVDVRGSPGGPISIRPPGTVVLLDFFATWCAPCKPEMANLRAAHATFSPERVFMVSITQESDEEAFERFWRRYEGTWPVAMDPELVATRRYDVTGVPTIIVLTPGGDVVMRHTGLAGEQRIEARIREALRTAGTS